MKPNDNFIKLIPKLDVPQFIGLAKILKVQIVEEDTQKEIGTPERYTPRDFADVFSDVVKAFDSAPRTRKREIIQLLKAATKKGGKS